MQDNKPLSLTSKKGEFTFYEMMLHSLNRSNGDTAVSGQGAKLQPMVALLFSRARPCWRHTCKEILPLLHKYNPADMVTFISLQVKIQRKVWSGNCLPVLLLRRYIPGRRFKSVFHYGVQSGIFVSDCSNNGPRGRSECETCWERGLWSWPCRDLEGRGLGSSLWWE